MPLITICISIEGDEAVARPDPARIGVNDEAVWDSAIDFTVHFDNACPFGQRVFHRGKHSGLPQVPSGERRYVYNIDAGEYCGEAAVVIASSTSAGTDAWHVKS